MEIWEFQGIGKLFGIGDAFCMTFTIFSLMCLKGKIGEQSVSFLPQAKAHGQVFKHTYLK